MMPFHVIPAPCLRFAPLRWVALAALTLAFLAKPLPAQLLQLNIDLIHQNTPGSSSENWLGTMSLVPDFPVTQKIVVGPASGSSFFVEAGVAPGSGYSAFTGFGTDVAGMLAIAQQTFALSIYNDLTPGALPSEVYTFSILGFNTWDTTVPSPYFPTINGTYDGAGAQPTFSWNGPSSGFDQISTYVYPTAGGVIYGETFTTDTTSWTPTVLQPLLAGTQYQFGVNYAYSRPPGTLMIANLSGPGTLPFTLEINARQLWEATTMFTTAGGTFQPVPEPSTWFAGVAALSFTLATLLRRRRSVGR